MGKCYYSCTQCDQGADSYDYEERMTRCCACERDFCTWCVDHPGKKDMRFSVVPEGEAPDEDEPPPEHLCLRRAADLAPHVQQTLEHCRAEDHHVHDYHLLCRECVRGYNDDEVERWLLRRTKKRTARDALAASAGYRDFEDAVREYPNRRGSAKRLKRRPT